MTPCSSTGCGLPPGPNGLLGAAEGVSYLVVTAIACWSVYNKVRPCQRLQVEWLQTPSAESVLSSVAAQTAPHCDWLQKCGWGLNGTSQCFTSAATGSRSTFAPSMTLCRVVPQVATGKGLRPGPGGVLGIVEGLSLTGIAAGLVVLALQVRLGSLEPSTDAHKLLNVPSHSHD